MVTASLISRFPLLHLFHHAAQEGGPLPQSAWIQHLSSMFGLPKLLAPPLWDFNMDLVRTRDFSARVGSSALLIGKASRDHVLRCKVWAPEGPASPKIVATS
jgi:hypothetical protein